MAYHVDYECVFVEDTHVCEREDEKVADLWDFECVYLDFAYACESLEKARARRREDRMSHGQDELIWKVMKEEVAGGWDLDFGSYEKKESFWTDEMRKQLEEECTHNVD